MKQTKILLFSETPNLYENNHYHEECLKCNSCGMNLSGPNQKRARRFKNHILCDLHFADMALMESSDFMQWLRNFKNLFLDKILLFSETPNLYENNHYHEECLKCNSCGMNLSGPNQKRARRFKNHILCDLHFADMALMESSDFMQQLRNFKPQVCK